MPPRQSRLPGSRTVHACVRCRRQKLKCDRERPCLLCTRAGAQCEEGELPKRKRQRTGQEHIRGPSSQRLLTEITASETDPAVGEVAGVEASDRIPALSQDRASTYGLIDQLFNGLDTEHGPLTGFNAIPDATTATSSSATGNGEYVRLRDVMGFNLPARDVTLKLFDVFIDSVHWFMMVLHEPSLRADLAQMLDTGLFPKRKLSTIFLVMVVLLNATKYAVVEEIPAPFSSNDLSLLQTVLLEKVESGFLTVLDQDDVGVLQICVLFSSFYFYHGRPNRCLAINSAAIKLAERLKFHRESSWKDISLIEREVRRRVWWAIYVLDGYGALTFGMTNIIQHTKCQVELPQNADDTDTFQGIESYEVLENGSSEKVTTMSYQRHKFRLYCIAEPIMSEIYFNDKRSVREVVSRVQAINAKLIEWQNSVPLELDLKTISHHHNRQDRTTKIFQVQALALQLCYDNIQLVLHRPLLFHNRGLFFRPPLKQPMARTQTDEVSGSVSSASKEICWNAAYRTSRIDEFPEALKQSRNCHVGGYTGVQTFTAGFVLGIFALSQPLSAQAQEAKRAIGRLVKMPKLFGYRTAISDQTENILQRLLRVILDQEMKLLTAGEVNAALDGARVDRDTATDLDSRAPSTSEVPTQSNTSRRTPLVSTMEGSAHAGAMSNGISTRAAVQQNLDHMGFMQNHNDDDKNDADSTWINFDINDMFTDTKFLDDITNIGQGWIWDDMQQFL